MEGGRVELGKGVVRPPRRVTSPLSGLGGKGPCPLGLQELLRGPRPRPCLTPSGHLSPGRVEVRRWEGRKGGNQETQTSPRQAGAPGRHTLPSALGPHLRPRPFSTVWRAASESGLGPQDPLHTHGLAGPHVPPNVGDPASQIARPGFGKLPELGSRRPCHSSHLLAPSAPCAAAPAKRTSL